MSRTGIQTFVVVSALFTPFALGAPPAAEMSVAVSSWFDGQRDKHYKWIHESRYADPVWGTTVESTGNGTCVHLFVFDHPANRVLFMPRMGGNISEVEIADKPAIWRAVDDGLLVDLPDEPTDGAFTVVTVGFIGTPLVYEAPSFVGPEVVYAGEAQVLLETGTPLEIRYTIDGSEPRADSRLFEGPIALGEGMEIRARSYFNGRPVSRVVSREYERMALWPPTEMGESWGLLEEQYTGRWSRVPDFDKLTPVAARRVENFGFAASSAAEFVGIRQRGFVRVPRDGVYRFELTCDDGGRLWIDGKLVVDNDGLHVSQMRAGTAPLAAGAHEIVVGYFNATGDSSLAVRMGMGPDAMARIPPPDLTHNAPKGEEP